MVQRRCQLADVFGPVAAAAADSHQVRVDAHPRADHLVDGPFLADIPGKCKLFHVDLKLQQLSK